MANYLTDAFMDPFMLAQLKQQEEGQYAPDDNDYVVRQLMGIAEPRASYGQAAPMQEQDEGNAMLQNMLAMSMAPQASFGSATPSSQQAMPQSASASMSRSGIMPRSSIEELYNRVNSRGLESIAEQKKGLKKTRGLIEDIEKQQLQTNLAPFLAATDWLTDSNLSKMYQKPMSEEDRKMKILELENMAQRQAGAISDDDLKLLGLQISRETAAARAGGAGGKPTADQWKAATFAKRLEQAEEVFSNLVGKGYDRTQRSESMRTLLPGEMQGEDLKSQDQAERNFVNSVLRRESGAAISASEFKSAEQQYFPRPGDDAQTLQQKAANRAIVFESLKAEAQGTFDKIPTISPILSQVQPGTVEDGYKFKGGNPSDPNNWEKQ